MTAVSSDSARSRYARHLFGRWPQNPRRRIATVVRILAIIALALWTYATPKFFTQLSLLSLLTSISFVGCVAVGMTFITISGNIMSLSLGVTASVAALAFLSTLSFGVFGAVCLALLAAAAISGVQGMIVGYLRGNAILISIAALALIVGISNLVTGGERIYSAGGGYEIFKARLLGAPVEVLIFFGCVVIAQLVLSYTRIGQSMMMVGSNQRAAEIVGLRTWAVVTFAYLLAGVFAGVSGILLASRYGSADVDLGMGYDYGAIAAVLVGATSIHGGSGSIFRTAVGCLIIAAVQSTLLLRGFRQEYQYLITGLIVLGVILLQSVGEGRRA